MFKKTAVLIMAMMMATVACASPLLINGAGATFPYPIYSKWFDTYSKMMGVQFNYQSIGSGGGIKQITARTVDFGASDGPMNAEEMAAAPDILHIPMVMGAVVVSYNLPGLNNSLKLSQSVLADIFLGKITSWTDPRIASINPGVTLPDEQIIVVHRSDGSGTSFIFTSYLTAISGEWASRVGMGKSVRWPVGLGGKGNEGVAGFIKQTQGSIGYVELAYAITNKLPYATLENKSGNYIVPTLDSTSLAAQGVPMPDDFRVSIVNSPNPKAYPIAGFTWLLIYKHMDDAVKGKAIVDFIRWAVHDGQKYTKELLYAPLPPDVVKKIDAKLDQVTF